MTKSLADGFRFYLRRFPLLFRLAKYLYYSRARHPYDQIRFYYNWWSSRRAMARARHKVKPRILFYHVSGLFFGGTEKYLQILAKHMDPEHYDSYFLYSPKPRNLDYGPDLWNQRLSYMLDSRVKLIPFDYDEYDLKPPHIVHGMSPNILDVIKLYDIDLLVTVAGSYAEFPLCMIRHIPIIIINIFGLTYDQSNVAWHVCISHQVAQHARAGVPQQKIVTCYIPTEGPLQDSQEAGSVLRRRLGIPDDEIMFGRIGRGDDGIFHPIGIRAFQRVVQDRPWIHYLIMSPMSTLRQAIEDEHIPNVHFLPPSGNERDVWAFHCAQDVMAHFRNDGESCGLSIGEAMLCGKPIITHRSRYWNAHLEYLDETCALVAGVDDVDQYASHLALLADDRGKRRIRRMGESARYKAEPLFLIGHTIRKFESLVESALGCRSITSTKGEFDQSH